MRVLALATRNPGKAREFRDLLAGLPFEIRTLDDYPEVPPPPEEADTFEDVARAKAAFVAEATGEAALADDSGLEVDALDGAPGVRSARFLGEDATDAQRNAKILKLLASVPDEGRGARFKAAVAVAESGGIHRVFVGTVEGRIARAARGEGGFGYDPIFELPDGRTLAEYALGEKNRISHRARAFAAARPMLESLAGHSG